MNFNRTIFISILLVLCCVTRTLGQNISDSTSDLSKPLIADLSPGVQVERRLSGDRVDRFRTALKSGEYLGVIVEPNAIDVAVTLIDPNGHKIVEVNEFGANGAENVFFVAQNTGDHLFEIRVSEKNKSSGIYKIHIQQLRAATREDRAKFEAQLSFFEGTEITRKGRAPAELLQQGIEKFDKARILWHAVGDGIREANALNQLGEFQRLLGDSKRALEYLTEALQLAGAVHDHRAQSESLSRLGMVHLSLGEFSIAVDCFSESLKLKRTLNSPFGEAQSLYGIGVARLKSGQTEKALELFKSALSNARLTHDSTIESSALTGIGDVYYTQGDWRKALEYHREALASIHGVGDERTEALALNAIGADYANLGELKTGLEYRNQALSLRRLLGDKRGEAYTLNGLAVIYTELGEREKALAHYNKSLDLMRTIGDQYGESYVLTGLGVLEVVAGRTESGCNHFRQALTLARAVGDRAGEAKSLRFLARNQYRLTDPRTAMEYLDQAFIIAKEMHDQVQQLLILSDIAHLETDQNHLQSSIAHLEAAINLAESMRQSITSRDLRASYMTLNRGLYESYIDVLMHMYGERDDEAFAALGLQASERARARSLLDILTDSETKIVQKTDPLLMQQQKAVQLQIRAEADRLTKMLQSKRPEAQRQQARSKVDLLLKQAQEIDARIRTANTRYASLVTPRILSLKEIQDELLDEDTLLLEYALGEDHSYVWAVTKHSLKTYQLPGRNAIEDSARRAYGLFVSKSDVINRDALTQLSEILLQPVAAELAKKRIFVVSEGALQLIPFGALPDPNASSVDRAAANGAPLILNHEVVSAPSASVLAVMRRELTDRKPMQHLVAVLADPVFDDADKRVAHSAGSKHTLKEGQNGQVLKRSLMPNVVERSITDSGIETFERLINSRREAQNILDLAPPALRMRALDFAASKATATNADLGSYRIIHFATHSVLNDEHPELSGIVLSLVDESGRPQDGFLRLFEIYNLQLSADLVVLSSCQSALGKDLKGEGLVGLTRGFMYAGVPRVVASLWKVNDAATAELMKRFYENLLKRDLRPAEALRFAQISMRKEVQWRAPYYWAGFVLQGEWR